MTNDDQVAYFKANLAPVIQELEDKKIDIARKLFEEMKHEVTPEDLPPLNPQDMDILTRWSPVPSLSFPHPHVHP